MTNGNKIQGELVFLWGDLPSYSLVKFQNDLHISRNTLLKLPSSGRPPSKTKVTLAASHFSALLVLPFSSSLSFDTLLLHRQVKPRASKMAQELKVLATKPAYVSLILETQIVKEMNLAKAL